MSAKELIQKYFSQKAVVFHFLTSQQKVKREIFFASSAPRAQRAVQLYNRKESYFKNAFAYTSAISK